MNTEDLLQALAQRLGFEALRFDSDGICSLAFEERFTVTLERRDETDTLYLYSTLGPAPEDIIDQLTCFAALLEANLFGRGAGGANLGFEPQSQTLMISRVLPLNQLNAGALQNEFGLFVQATEAWCERVAARFWEDPDASEAREPVFNNSGNPGRTGFIKV